MCAGREHSYIMTSLISTYDYRLQILRADKQTQVIGRGRIYVDRTQCMVQTLLVCADDAVRLTTYIHEKVQKVATILRQRVRGVQAGHTNREQV